MGEVLFFSVGPFRGAVPLADTVEVFRMVQPEPPKNYALPWDCGTINLHGLLIPVIAMRALFGIPLSTPTPAEILVITRVNDRTVALRVDAVAGTGKRPPLPDYAEPANIDRSALPGSYVSFEGIYVFWDLNTLLSVLFDKNAQSLELPYCDLVQNLSHDQQCAPEAVPQADAASVTMLLEERARILALPSGDMTGKKTTKVLTFRLAGREFGIALSYIREVVLTGRITRVPGTPGYIAGICIIRGEIVSLVDLRVLLPIQHEGITDLNRVIVVSGDILTLGLLVDRITGIEEIDTGSLPVREEADPGNRNVVHAVKDRSLSFIDMDVLFSDPRMVIDES